jgi:3-oxoacyl-[acyl-carrier-protein] synthase-3
MVNQLQILSAGHFHPETIINNSFLESLNIGTSDEWIMERVGIRERRTVLPLDYIYETKNQDSSDSQKWASQTIVDMGVLAAQSAMERAQVIPSQIGLVIAGTCTPQLGVPAHACAIAGKLGIRCPAFDLQSACATLATQLHFMSSMSLSHLPDYILLIQTDAMTTITNYADRSTAVLFGDGAAAQILSPKKKGKGKIIATTFGSNPLEFKKVFSPTHLHLVQEGSAVQRFAITQTVATYQELQKRAETKIDHFVAHQANLRMLETVCSRIGILKEQHKYNVDGFGNCGGAGAASILSRDWDFFQPGQHLGIVVVGGGLSWGGAVLKFGDDV